MRCIAKNERMQPRDHGLLNPLYLWRDSKSKEAPGLRALMADSTVRSPAAEHARPWLTAKAEFEKLLPFALSSCEQAWVAV